MNTTMHRTSPVSRPLHVLSTVRDELRERRLARAERRGIQREMAASSTRGELDDLMALLHFHEGTQADEIRRVVNRDLRQRPNQLAS